MATGRLLGLVLFLRRAGQILSELCEDGVCGGGGVGRGPDRATDNDMVSAVGRLLNTDAIVQTIQEKQRLAERYGALAVDMESLAVAQVCRERETKFLAVRVISDDLAADLPNEVKTVIGSSGSARFGAALGAMWKRPGSIKEMWHLRETAHTAAERLATFLDGVVKQLYQTQH